METQAKKFSLKLKPEPVWISAADPLFRDTELRVFDPEEIEGFEFMIRPAGRGEIRKAIEAYTSTVAGSNGDEQEKFDNEGFVRERLRRILVDWRGLYDEAGNPIECNEKTRSELMDAYPQLRQAILNAGNWAMVSGSNRLGGIEKNLESSPGGSTDDSGT